VGSTQQNRINKAPVFWPAEQGAPGNWGDNRRREAQENDPIKLVSNTKAHL